MILIAAIQMEETAQYFERRFLINRSLFFIALPKFYDTHRNYEILSKSLVNIAQPDLNFKSKSSSLFILNHEMFFDKWSVKLLEVKEKLVFYTFFLCTQYLGVQFTT
jgi:hypothetical protein